MVKTNLALPDLSNSLSDKEYTTTDEDQNVFELIEKAETFHQDLLSRINGSMCRLQQLDSIPELVLRSKLEELNLLTHDLKELELDYVVRSEGLDQAPPRLDKTKPHDLKKLCKKYYKRLANILHTDKQTGNRELFDKAKFYYDHLDINALQYMYYSIVNKNSTRTSSSILKELSESAYRKLQSIRNLIDMVYKSSQYGIHNLIEHNNTQLALDQYRILISLNIKELDQKIAKIKFIIEQKRNNP
jgi:type I site-specific restriction endonuclease